MGRPNQLFRLFSRTWSVVVFSVGLAVMLVPPAFGHDAFDIALWPRGVVKYRFLTDPNNDPDDCTRNQGDLELCKTDKDRVRKMMDTWEKALTVKDPLSQREAKYIRFEKCTNDCPLSHLLIRNNGPDEKLDTCGKPPGRNPDGESTLRLDANQIEWVVLHELGHCLGLYHEQQRTDSDRWLQENPTPNHCDDNPDDCTADNYLKIGRQGTNLMPLLGNYDYDSIMHYDSFTQGSEEVLWTDALGNAFSSYAIVSERDKSRVLQYYARERYPGWGFFKSLSETSQHDPDELPYPYLAQGVEAVGTPTIAYQSPGNYDIFARGSDNHLYWKMYRQVNNGPPFSFVGWRSIGCCFSSDPSAVSRALDRIDVVAVNNSGEVQRIKYIDGNWSNPFTLRGGYPTGGLKQDADGNYTGPAIASRDADLLDVFVVRSDGRLAVTTWSAGNWGGWRTLGRDYNVTARPAAVALSATQVQLAINESDANLYEPLVTFPQTSFSKGNLRGTTAHQAPPALTKRVGQNNPYRVLITNADGRISIRGAVGAWLDIGGIPKPGTGPSAVATGDLTFKAVMNGEDATGCATYCSQIPGEAPPNVEAYIQPGGLWIRHFE